MDDVTFSETVTLEDLPQEEELEDLVRMAAEISTTPICLISVIDGEWVRVLASTGIHIKEARIDESFCKHTVQGSGLFVVEDALEDSRFKSHPLVSPDGGIRFYAGMPITSPAGVAIGTLCVVDVVPRKLTSNQAGALAILARQVQDRILLRNRNRKLEMALEEKAIVSKKLRDTLDLLSAFLDNGPFVSYIKDAGGRYVFHNNSLANHFCAPGEDLIGLTDHDIFPKDSADVYRAHDLQVLGQTSVIQSDETSIDSKGALTPWRSYKFPFRTEDGNLMVAGLSIDITEEVERQKALEQALADQVEAVRKYETSQFVLQVFMDNIPNHAYLKSEDGSYLFYNRSFAHHFGISQSEWIGKSDHQIFPKHLADNLRNDDLELLMTGVAPETLEHYVGANRQLLTFRHLKFTYRSAEGSPIIAGLSIDVTERIDQHELFEPGVATKSSPLAALTSVTMLKSASSRTGYVASNQSSS